MEQIRVDLIRLMVIGLGFIYGHKHVKKQVDKVADQILDDITLRRGGGVCDRCKGRGFKPHRKIGGPIITCNKCPKCKGTGELPVKEKSIKDILKEWEDGSK